MPRFAANLNLLFADAPMLDRFARAEAAGFSHVEVLFPYRDGLDAVAERLARHHLKLVLFDAEPGKFAAGERGFLCHQGAGDRLEQQFRQALDVARRLDCQLINVLAGNVLFHLQQMEGNLIQTLTDNLADIAHIQIGDVPGRHEPGTGEINYPNLFAALDRLGYQGFVGLEYIPAGQTEAGLDAWLPRDQRACV